MQLERYIKRALGLKKWNSEFLIREETKDKRGAYRSRRKSSKI